MKDGHTKGYVFVSHSHEDLDIVRKIRNKLEESDLDPILFYLHCMDNPSSEEAKELERLIHKEIDAREYFLYAKSKNSEKSKWVQDELNYIKQTKPMSLKTLNLDCSEDFVFNELQNIIAGRRIFLSYSHDDVDLADSIFHKLIREDFVVIKDTNMNGENENSMINAESTYIILASDSYFNSSFCCDEFDFISKQNAKKIVIAEDKDIFNFMSDSFWKDLNTLGNYRTITFNARYSLEDNINNLIGILKSHTVDCPWGPDRKMFSVAERGPDYAVFNSIIDNPGIGDERNFCRIRDIECDNLVNEIELVPGRTYEVYIYYHNCANKDVAHKAIGIADAVTLTCNFPALVRAGYRETVNAKISCNDTDPLSVWAGSYLTSNEDCCLKYVPGSASIFNGGKLNGKSIGPDWLFGEGAVLGYNEFSGMIPGGFEYAGHIKFRLLAKSAR